jgi:hydroxymethylpyrimidine/phosphomethylpyrimidine kinase
VVAKFLERLRRDGRKVPVVLDPVVRSSSGRELLSAGGVEVLRERLLPLVDWVTPNRDELEVLTGVRDGAEAAVRRLREMVPGLNVVATGGDLEGADDLVMLASGQIEWVRGEKIESRSTHGTGCAFSSALLSRLVQGEVGVEAVRGAKDYVTEAIRQAKPRGRGLGPLDHLWPLRG